MLLLAYCSRVFLPMKPDALSAAREKEFQEMLRVTDNGVIREKLRTVTPPEINCSKGGIRALEELSWSSLGNFAAALCTEGAGGSRQ